MTPRKKHQTLRALLEEAVSAWVEQEGTNYLEGVRSAEREMEGMVRESKYWEEICSKTSC